MKAIMRWGSGLVALLLFTSGSFAWEWASPVFKTPFPVAPDACGPGWYNRGPCGMVYGPNYYLVPPGMPFNGMLPGKQGQCLMAAQQGIPPWVMQQQAAQAGGRGMPMPHPPGAMPYPPGTPYPPGAMPYPPGTPYPPLPPGTPNPYWNSVTPPTPPTPPNAPGAQATGVYPTHPYVRGPRDFFMWNEVMEEQRGGNLRPARVTP